MWGARIGPLAALAALVLLTAACDDRAPQAATTTVTATASPSPPAATATAILTPAPTPAGAPAASTPAPTAVASPPLPAPTAARPAATSAPAASVTPVATPPETPAPGPTLPPSGSGTPTTTPTPGPATPEPEPVAHVTASVGVPVRLAQGVVAGLPGGRTLALFEVTADSRCPADVQCVWAGEANLLFEWAAPGETHRVPVVIGPARGASDLPGGFVLRVLALNPGTRTGDPIPASAYVATVVVERAGQPTSGAFGSITVGPSCAVQREGVPCPDRPLAATLVFRDQAGVEVGRALSDVTGFYAVALPAGRIQVVPFTPGGATLPRGIPRDIDVPAGDWIVADVMYDSGIR